MSPNWLFEHSVSPKLAAYETLEKQHLPWKTSLSQIMTLRKSMAAKANMRFSLFRRRLKSPEKAVTSFRDAHTRSENPRAPLSALLQNRKSLSIARLFNMSTTLRPGLGLQFNVPVCDAIQSIWYGYRQLILFNSGRMTRASGAKLLGKKRIK